jgi:peptidyl-prolyl cis-trans isomerase D
MIRFLQTPGKAKKYVLGGLLLVICAAMVITLIPGGFLGDAFGFGTPAGVIAKVGDHEVTLAEAQQTARNIGRQQFGGRSVPSQLMPLLMQNAVESLIMQKAMLVEADRMGLTVSNDELRDALQRTFAQQLFPGGNFIGQDDYENFVQQNFDMTVPQFENEFKTEVLLSKLRNVVEGAATVSDAELQQAYNRQNTKVKFDYAVLNYDDILKQIQPTDAELKAYYEKNKELYKNAIPEKRKAQYVVIDTSKLQGKVQVTPDELNRYYNQHQDEYRVPEQVNLRQIVIKTPAPGPDGKVDQKAVDAARAKAQDILNKIKAGGNFADLAKKYSEDTATAKNGGEVGDIQRGQTMPEIDKAAFSMNKGQTELVQTGLGFFILQVQDKQSAHVKPLSEVKDTIEQAIKQEKAAKQAEALANTVQSQARTSGLASAAQKNGLDLVDTGMVTATDTLPGIGSAPEFMQALFQAQQNGPADTVQVPQGYVVFQVTAIQPPAQPTFEEVKSRVETDFKNERAQALLAQKTQQMADRAHAEHNLKAAAKEVGASVKTSDLVTPQSQVPDIGSMSGPASVAFTLKPGEISGPISAGRNGVVIALLDRQEPTQADFEKDKEQIRQQVLYQKRSEMFELFAANLRDRMQKEGKIRINQKELNRAMPADRGE